MRLALFLLALLPLAATAAAPPRPFSADYAVYQNGERMGRGEITLRALGGGRFELVTRSEATAGLAGLAGVTREERSVLAWRGGTGETVEYRMQQKTGWSQRRHDLTVDPRAGRVTSTYKDRTTVLPYRPGVVDSHGVTALLMSALAAGARGELRFPVADRRSLEEQAWRVAADVRLRTAIGRERAVRVERVRADGGRATRVWFARERGWLPLRIQQVEASGETLDLRITAVH